MKLTQAFYHRETRLVAQALLGNYLVRFQDGLPLVVRIQETEAYIGRMDKACHAYNYRRTPRTETLFAPPGTAYIYLIYGMHCCLNFVTEPEGEPSAVLLRGLAPVHGLEALCRLLQDLGGSAFLEGDCLVVQGGTPLTGGAVMSYGDHRIAMAAAVAASLCTGPVRLIGAEAVTKSYPRFWQDYQSLGGIWEEIS